MTDIPNVRWDHSAADAARAELKRAADLLRGTAGERSRAAQVATAEWRGRYREEFDADLRRILAEAEELASRFEAAAQRIDGASARAREEQRRREREREERSRQAE
jgi:uncharacterized protein YukE